MTFRVGQKVVCVRNRLWLNPNPVQPSVGTVYTIRDMFLCNQGNPSVRLVELKAPMHSDGGEYGFLASRFRPIVERKTSIEIFQRMLLPQGVDA